VFWGNSRKAASGLVRARVQKWGDKPPKRGWAKRWLQKKFQRKRTSKREVGVLSNSETTASLKKKGKTQLTFRRGKMEGPP